MGWKEWKDSTYLKPGQYLVVIYDKGSWGYSDPSTYQAIETWNGTTWFDAQRSSLKVTHYQELPLMP